MKKFKVLKHVASSVVVVEPYLYSPLGLHDLKHGELNLSSQ
jgi:hypothetical protein